MSSRPVESEKMPDGDEPLLSKNGSPRDSEEDPEDARPAIAFEPRNSLTRSEEDLAEEAELLNGDHYISVSRPRSSRWRTCREVALFVWALFSTAIVVVLAVVYERSLGPPRSEPVHCPPFPSMAAFVPPSHSLPAPHFPAAAAPTGKRNLVFMVSDGMGPSSMALARHFKEQQEGPPWIDSLEMDKFLIGTSRTRSSSSLITDSAAGATAFSCGKKTYNGGISVLPDGEPCGTVLEAAKQAGYMTGLVVTTSITDATPAVWASHAHSRKEENLIAEQLIGNGPLGHLVDLMLGGGLCHFLPEADDSSCRDDDRDLVKRAEDKGYSWIRTRTEFDHFNSEARADLPLLGLFADDNFPYEIDQLRSKESFPSLKEMTQLALRLLSNATSGSDKGFFLMIEGSRIDHAGHAQDPAAHAQEILAYDDAFAAVVDFLNNDNVPGLAISTSDHETGGLATAKQLDPVIYPEYHWFPSKLREVIKSAEYMAAEYQWYLAEHAGGKIGEKTDMTVYLESKLKNCFGIDDPSSEELNYLLDNPENALHSFAKMINRRSQHGHSGADVNIYASDPQKASFLTGNVENTDIGRFLEAYLGVDVNAITEQLKQTKNDTINGQGWLGPRPDKDLSYDAHSHYMGDYRLKKRLKVNLDVHHHADWASRGWC